MSITRYLVLGSLSLSLNAATLFYSDYDPGRSAVVSFNLNGTEQIETSGVMMIQVDGGPWQAAFCGDVFAGIAQNTTYDANGAFMNNEPYTRVAWLMANALPMIVSGSPAAGAEAAALQLAIWDILHDNGNGLTDGQLQQSANTSQAVRDAFAGYLAAPWTPTTGLVRYQLTFQNTQIPAQDIITHVPEPGTFVMAGLAMAGLAIRRRRN
jgi:hypothetical protein